MATTKINLNGLSEIDFTNGIASASNVDDVTTITLSALGVTSVGLTAPTEFNVAGSPVTSSGTIALTWNTETANFVFAGPTSGGAATPGFRALVAADIPALPYVTGTGLTAGQLIIGAGSSAITVGNLSGDVTTSGSTAASVIKLRGAALDAIIGTAGAGQDGYVIYWDNASSSYKLKVVSGGSFAPTGTPTVGAGTAYSNSGSSATATASVTINIGDFVFVISGNIGGAAAVTISDNGTALVLTQVVPGTGGTAIYTGTITGGAANAHAGKIVTIAGFTNIGNSSFAASNNGSFMCVASTSTTLTLLNPYASTEIHAATAANTYYKLSSIGIASANFTNADCIWVCASAIVAATTITSAGVSGQSIAAATFTGVGGIGAISGNVVTTTPGTNTITTTKANSMVVTGFLYVAAGGTTTASSNTGTLRTNSDAGTANPYGTAIVTTQATTVGSYTNAITLSRTVATSICWTLELLPQGTQFDSNSLTFQNAYWNGAAATTDTWTMKATLAPTQTWLPALLFPSYQQAVTCGNGFPVQGITPLINRLEIDYSGEGGPLLQTPSMMVSGSIFLNKIPPVLTPTVTPTGGSATTWNYKVLGFDANNMPTTWSVAGTTTAGAATLVPGTAFNNVTWNNVPGLAYYQVARQVAGSGNFLACAWVPASSGATTTFVDDGAAASGLTLSTTGTINWTGGLNLEGVLLTSTPTSSLTGGGIAILTGGTANVPTISGWVPASNQINPNTSWTQIWSIGFGNTSDANARISFAANSNNFSLNFVHSRTTLTGDPGIGMGGGNWTITTGTAVEVSIGTNSGATAGASFIPTNGTGAYTCLSIVPTVNQVLVGPFNITNCNFTSATSLTITVSSGTGITNGATIVIAGCTGTNNAQANGTWTVASGGGTTTIVITGSAWTTGNHAEATGTIKQQATGAYTMILVNPTQTATGAAASANALIDLQVSNVSKFRVDSTGKIVVPSTNTTTSATAGANGAVPAQVVGYLTVNINGADQKIPYFNT